jgi:hypothetical protein
VAHDILHFGWSHPSGHTLRAPVGQRLEWQALPRWMDGGRALDGTFTPPWPCVRCNESRGCSHDPQPEGVAQLTHHEGWTVVAFWDRSGDVRGGSNSAFLVRGTLGFDEVVRAARAAFPEVWARFAFKVSHAR